MVSNYGRIISVSRPAPTFYGSKNKVHTVELLHRLVAIAFIENKDSKPMIDHIDRNKQNNRVDNLRWCTLSENMNNPLTVEHCRNMNIGRVYPTLRKPVVAIKNGVVVKQYCSIQSAVDDGFTRCGVSNCCAGRNPTHYGYKWMYLSDYEKSCQISKSKNASPDAWVLHGSTRH